MKMYLPNPESLIGVIEFDKRLPDPETYGGDTYQLYRLYDGVFDGRSTVDDLEGTGPKIDTYKISQFFLGAGMGNRVIKFWQRIGDQDD